MKAGVHFGHQSSRWHPKMNQFIHGSRNGVHIIDLEKTTSQLKIALDFVSGVVGRGGKVLFLGTKPQMQKYVKEAAESCGMPYVTGRWLGGTLTNFGEIQKKIKRLATLKRMKETGELAKKYNKREQLTFAREIEELEEKIGGISTLDKVPSALLVFDVRNEMTAIREANRIGVPIVAICDTNVNPDVATHCVPANDDAVKSIALMTALFSEAVKEAKTAEKAPVKKKAPARKVVIK